MNKIRKSGVSILIFCIVFSGMSLNNIYAEDESTEEVQTVNSTIEINEATFPDENFRQFVLDNYSENGNYLNQEATSEVKLLQLSEKTLVH
ncbi:MAG: hypothetical protein ACK5LC_14485 [Coprobacillaceae bacterium]